MSVEAAVECFKCGRELLNVCADSDNQPDGGTEFRTYGHYGSTVWDSFYGEELVLNICDECLRGHTERLARHKRYLPVVTKGRLVVGKQWVERHMGALHQRSRPRRAGGLARGNRHEHRRRGVGLGRCGSA